MQHTTGPAGPPSSRPSTEVALDETVMKLQADWPLWEIWIVHRVVGGTVWCARRHDDHKKVLNADSAEHLAEYLEDEAGR